MTPAFIAYQNRTVRQRRIRRKMQAAATFIFSAISAFCAFAVLVRALEIYIGTTP